MAALLFCGSGISREADYKWIAVFGMIPGSQGIARCTPAIGIFASWISISFAAYAAPTSTDGAGSCHFVGAA